MSGITPYWLELIHIRSRKWSSPPNPQVGLNNLYHTFAALVMVHNYIQNLGVLEHFQTPRVSLNNLYQ